MYNKLSLIIIVIVFSMGILNATVASYYFDTTVTEDTSILLNQIIRNPSVIMQITTDKASTCKYSQYKSISYENMEGTFDLNFETIHKKTITNLNNGIHKYYIKCKNSIGSVSKELEAKFNVNLPITGMITLEHDSPIKEGKTEITLTTSALVSQTPTLSYSFNGVNYHPIPLIGFGSTWTGYLIISDSEGEKAGSFKMQARDLEGNTGTEITSGGLFLVDTEKPRTITDIRATGYEGMIKLTWHLDEEDEIDEFKVYRSTSPTITHSDYYKTTDDEDYTDTSVEKGKTYYYKVTSIDEAGNEGDLSREVYATALLRNTTTLSTGLEQRYHGLVDSLISDVDLVLDTSKDVIRNMELKDDIEKQIYEDLKLSREIESAKSELNALIKETENYKTQSLTQSELDKKLNSGRLKLNTVKKKIPENIIIISEKSETRVVEESDITNLILELNPTMEESLSNKIIKKSIETIEDESFESKTLAYNLEISYLDGTRKDASLIKQVIDSTLEENENISIIEVIPKTVAESAIDLNIKNINYQVLKEDPIISFESNTKEIIYSLDEHIDLNSVKEIKTILIHDVIEKQDSPIFTGYFSFIDFQENKSYFGVSIGVLFVLFLGVYLYKTKKDIKNTEKIIPIQKKIKELNKNIDKERLHLAKEVYDSLSIDYKNLEPKERKKIFKDLEEAHQKIKQKEILNGE